MRRSIFSLTTPALILSVCAVVSGAYADAPNATAGGISTRSTEYASPERQEAALGHYARARALLVEALDEFEQGRSIARPDMLLNPEDWRLMVISKTEELNRLLDPQPRVTRSGVRFKATKSLLRTDRGDTRASYSGGAQDSNYAGEEQISEEVTKKADTSKLDTRAKAAAAEEKTTAKVLVSPRETKETDETISKIKELQQTVDRVGTTSSPEALAKDATEVPPAAKPATPKVEIEVPKLEPSPTAELQQQMNENTKAVEKISEDIKTDEQENLEISQAIEDAIKARLQKVESMTGQPAADQTGGSAVAPGATDLRQ